MNSKNWFEVSREGLAELQAGKPKHFIVRELLQNAFDEDISKCTLITKYEKYTGSARITVSDDSKEGFRNLADGYTMFGSTYKRKDPTKRGRFNCGEKELICLCDTAIIRTTTGTIKFNDKGRTILNDAEHRLVSGSVISVSLKMTKAEYDEMLEAVKRYIIPDNIEFIMNGSLVTSAKPFKSFKARLLTELEDKGILKRSVRETDVMLYKLPSGSKAMIFELGIPVAEIECDYDIDVRQKIPLGTDRETIVPSFLKNVYTEVLNATLEQITPETASNIWVREGMCGKNVNPEVVRAVVENRFGEKAAIANPFDPNANDEAISKGYNLIRGSEMSKEEWDVVKEQGFMRSTTEMFGKTPTACPSITPSKEQMAVRAYAEMLARELLGLSINVNFIKEKSVSCSACFGNNLLSFNVANLSADFFEEPLHTTSLILHEIAHSHGSHTDYSYHECLTSMSQKLLILALEKPEMFKEMKQ